MRSINPPIRITYQVKAFARMIFVEWLFAIWVALSVLIAARIFQVTSKIRRADLHKLCQQHRDFRKTVTATSTSRNIYSIVIASFAEPPNLLLKLPLGTARPWYWGCKRCKARWW
jgi:hypothetical protein